MKDKNGASIGPSLRIDLCADERLGTSGNIEPDRSIVDGAVQQALKGVTNMNPIGSGANTMAQGVVTAGDKLAQVDADSVTTFLKKLEKFNEVVDKIASV